MTWLLMPFRITSYHLRLHYITPSHTKTLKIEAFADPKIAESTVHAAAQQSCADM